jgi:cobalt-zinc-cadmium efflux system protein
MAADAGVSLGVVVAGILIMVKGWLWIDPAISLFIVAVVLISTWGLLRDSVNYAIDSVPKNINIHGIRQYLMGLDRIIRIHDLHVWPLSTTEVALSVHIEVNDNTLDNGLLWDIQQYLQDRFEIEHATIQVESTKGENNCLLDRRTDE